MPNTHTRSRQLSHRRALSLLGVAAAIAYSAPLMTPLGQAHASGGVGFFISDKVTVRECSDCHQAYDPGLMPQGSWKRIMADLPNHFGENASLDEETRAHIENFLVSHALPGDGPIRITEQPWFKREHGGGFSFISSLFRSGPEPALSNCNACHGMGG